MQRMFKVPGSEGSTAMLTLPQAMQRGLAAYQRGELAEAERLCQAVLDAKSDYFDALHLLGVITARTGRPNEAVALLSRAVLSNPKDAVAHNHLGNVLRVLKRPAEALRSYERALALKPDHAEAYNNRGNALGDLKRPEEALRSYEQAIALEPDYASAHWNLALCRLLLGDFALGWQGYEWRLKQDQHTGQGRDFVQPLWLGAQALKDKTILLHSEQGLGDTLQFCRYATEVAALGANVLLEVQPSLAQLLADLEGVTQVLQKDSPLPAFDYHCPLMSLPLVFKTDLHSIPSRIPYIRSDAARGASWQQRLGVKTKPRVGLVWSGNTTHANDHNLSLIHI